MAEEDAKEAAGYAFLDEMGKYQFEELNKSEQSRLGRRRAKAAKAIRLEIMEQEGVDDLDLKPRHELVTGVQGGGKTQAVVRRLARESEGQGQRLPADDCQGRGDRRAP